MPVTMTKLIILTFHTAILPRELVVNVYQLRSLGNEFRGGSQVTHVLYLSTVPMRSLP
jgi:hypothetical protein